MLPRLGSIRGNSRGRPRRLPAMVVGAVLGDAFNCERQDVGFVFDLSQSVENQHAVRVSVCR